MRINLNSKSKKKIILTGLSAAVVILIIAVCLFSVLKTTKSEKKANPELARAMEYGELTEKDEETQSQNVRFSAYFARDLNGDGYAEKVKGTCKEVEGEDTLYMSLNVLEDGYLENGKIEIEEDNMYFKTALVDDDAIEGNYISENTTVINLKDVQAGTQKLIFGQVRTGDYRYSSTKRDAIGNDTNKYSGINKIKLTGTHVANDGERTDIEKVIKLPVDWYGTTKAEIATTGVNGEKNKYQNYNSEGIINEEKQEVNLEFKIVAQESNNQLLLSKSTIEGTIPELNGYKATKVEIMGENLQSTYNEETGVFTAYREANTTEDGVVNKEAYSSTNGTIRYHEIKLKVTYPIEAYEIANESNNGTVTIQIPVKATFEGDNNPNEEFTNPYISNIAEDVITVTYGKTEGSIINFGIQVGAYVGNGYNANVISKENALTYYNNDENKSNDIYEVRWGVARGNSGKIANIQLREQDANYTDKFSKIDGTYVDMLKYSKNIGIYFTTPGAMFGENGWIRVYNDQTNTLIHEFTSADWDTYTKENPYMYDEPVDHIRIETSSADKVSNFTVNHIKELNNELLTTDIAKEEFELIRYNIYERLFKRGSNFILNIIISRIGAFQYAAHLIMMQFLDLINNFLHGTGIGTQTMIATAIGSDNNKKVNEATKIVNKINKKIVYTTTSIIGIAMIIFLPYFLIEKESLVIGYKLLIFVVLDCILSGFYHYYSSILRAMKEFKYTSKLSLFISGFLRLILAFVLSRVYGIYGVWICFIISDFIMNTLLNKRIEKYIISNK